MLVSVSNVREKNDSILTCPPLALTASTCLQATDPAPGVTAAVEVVVMVMVMVTVMVMAAVVVVAAATWLYGVSALSCFPLRIQIWRYWLLS